MRDQFKLLKKVLPSSKTIGVIFDIKSNLEYIKKAEAIAQEMGLALNKATASSPQDVYSAAHILAQDSDVLWVIPDPVVLEPKAFEMLLMESLKSKIPILAPSGSFVKKGALLGLVPDYKVAGATAAEVANKMIARGNFTGIPVVLAKPKGYAINQRVMKRLGISLPPNILEGAAEVYK